jgi:putative Mn2+ efflux pump MntP
MTIGIAASIDTVAAGFGLGLYGVPILLAVDTTAAGSLVMSFLGFNSRERGLKGRGTHSDALASLAMTAMAAALVARLL